MRGRHLVLSCVLIAACGPSERSTTGGDAGVTADGRATDAEKCEDVIDVVFVLDTSSSMDFVLTKLEQQIEQVVTASNMVAADSHFGLIVFQDNHFIDTTGPLDQTDGGNYDLDQVKSGTLSLADTINEVVLDSHCNPILL